MNRQVKSTRWLSCLATAICAALLVMATQATAQSPDDAQAIVVEQSPSLVTFVGGTAKSPGRLKVRIDGPDGESVFASVSDAGILDWVVHSDLPDGYYRWDAWSVPQSTSGSGEVKGKTEPGADYESGTFLIEGGVLVPLPDAEETFKGESEMDLSANRSSVTGLEGLIGAVLTAIVPEAVAVTNTDHIQMDDTNPLIFFNDSNSPNAGDNDWTLFATENSFAIRDDRGSQNPLVLHIAPDPNDNAANAIFIDPSGNIGFSTDNPGEDLDLHDPLGSSALRLTDVDDGTFGQLKYNQGMLILEGNTTQNIVGIDGTAPINSVFIDGAGDMGLGTSTPADPIHIVDLDPTIRLHDTTDSSIMQLEYDAGAFAIQAGEGTEIVQIQQDAPASSLEINNFGDIGLGTVLPDAPLHVLRSDGSARVLVDETSGTNALRQMFALRNNGSIRFVMANTSGNNWAFSTGSAGFSISRAGTGTDVLVENDGDMEVKGDVTANGVVLDSSRELKTDFSSVDEHTVLEKVASLDVSQWRYKREPGAERHIGPMAEDFQALFGLGDGKHISVGDANGILFAAAKALKQENEALRTELVELREAVEAIRGTDSK